MSDELYQKPWASGMDRLMAAGIALAQGNAPYRTGELKGSIRGRIQKRPVPLWVAVDVTAKHARGGLTKRGRVSKAKYAYPRRLEFDAKLGHKGWLLGSVKRQLSGKAENILQRIAQEIEHLWGRVT